MLLLILAMSFAVVTAREFTAEELASFPRLFHLDDYERCLARAGGLYCLGTFELTPERYPHPTYELMKEYSNNRRRHFNRTLIHRGYCLSERCPSAARNASLRFERCADRFARARLLRANLRQLEYCRSHADAHAQVPPSAAQQTFLKVVYAILALNIIGTACDIMAKNKPNKNKLLTSWSIPVNWRELTSAEIGKDARTNILSPLHGFRVLSILVMSFFHTFIIHYSFYVENPEILENMSYKAETVFQSDGTSTVQTYIVLSSFLTCYNLLLFSEKHALSFKFLPIFIVKRVIRLAPVHLFIVGFGATWWLHVRDGPLVTSVLSVESRACEPKFWYHAFFLNNLNREAGYCITPTWFLPVDMHLSILACSMTVVLRCGRGTILKLYIALAAVFSLLNTVMIKHYKPFDYFTSPEYLRGLMRDSQHMTNFYMTTWTSLPSCFVGMIMAHIQYEIQRRDVKLSGYKWVHYVVFSMSLIWALASDIIRVISPQLLISAFNAVDKTAFYIIIIVNILGLINIDGQLRRLMCWKGFGVIARLSLPVMLLHWCVGMIIVARPTAFATSTTNQLLDWIVIIVITHALAVPITLFIEMPAQKILSFLMF